MKIALPMRNVHRTVGTLLAGEVYARFGAAGLPDDTIDVTFTGSVGQSVGAFLAPASRCASRATRTTTSARDSPAGG